MIEIYIFFMYKCISNYYYKKYSNKRIFLLIEKYNKYDR